jgi:hypothetical protein
VVHGGNPILCPPLDHCLFGNAPFTAANGSAPQQGESLIAGADWIVLRAMEELACRRVPARAGSKVPWDQR